MAAGGKWIPLFWNRTCRRILGLCMALTAGVVLWRLPLDGLSLDGQKCLALSAAGIILWAFEVFPLGYTSMGLLMGYSLAINPLTAGPGDIFGFFTKPMAYMIISGFIIAGAVRASGLARRLALFLISRYISDYRHVIICCYLLSYIMAVMIPQPFARAFLILSIMQLLLKDSGLGQKHAANIGLAVFAAQNGAGMMVLTGDSSLNMMILSQIPEAFRPSWGQWLYYMAVPALLTGACMCALQLFLFGQPESFRLDRGKAKEELDKLKGLSAQEIRMMVWLLAAVGLWLTDTIHGIDIGWVSVGVTIGMALPLVGNLVDGSQIKEVNLNTLLFLCASMAIGSVGTKTGMSSFLAGRLLPAHLGDSLAALFLVTGAACILLHLLLGSIMAVFSLAVPALLTITAGVSPLVVGLLVYVLTVGQWFFPYQSLSLTIGLGEGEGGYSAGTASRFGLAYTVPSLLCGGAALMWWRLVGLL
ncbi:SLC13 family permease [Enterocloster aldenensis]|uniref:SLC13 family permease n=1 Tax=Enterocloster aldenensis TaxID=358742 RepID=UPI004029D030